MEQPISHAWAGYVGFHSHGGTRQWMIYNGKCHLEMDDEQGYPYFRKPPYWVGTWILKTTISWKCLLAESSKDKNHAHITRMSSVIFKHIPKFRCSTQATRSLGIRTQRVERARWTLPSNQIFCTLQLMFSCMLKKGNTVKHWEINVDRRSTTLLKRHAVSGAICLEIEHVTPTKHIAAWCSPA